MRPGMMSAGQAARALDCPEAFLRLMADHGVLAAQSDGSYRAADVARLRRTSPWSHLGVPMSEGELCRLFHAHDMPIRLIASGDKVMRIAGCDYLRPRDALAAVWRRDA